MATTIMTWPTLKEGVILAALRNLDPDLGALILWNNSDIIEKQSWKFTVETPDGVLPYEGGIFKGKIIDYEEPSIALDEILIVEKDPRKIEQKRQEEAITRQQTQDNTQLQQVDSNIVEQNIPGGLKPKGKAKFGQRILNLGKQTIKLILPKLTSLAQEYAIGEFETAKAAATSPEQIDALKQQFCPAPDQLQRLIDTRNNIVGQLNSIGTKLNTLNFSINGLQDITNTLKTLLSTADAVKLATSAISRTIPNNVIPVLPGFVPALLIELETIGDDIVPLLEKNSGSINATTIPIAVVTSIISKIVNALDQLDDLIKLCSPNSTLDSISDTIIQTANNQTLSDTQSQLGGDIISYKGFSFQIEEVPFSPTVTRRKAIALNQQGIPLLETPLSFTANNQTLIDELKLIIDRDNLKSF